MIYEMGQFDKKERLSLIKPIWTVRNPQKLFTGLAFAVSGLMLVYTIMNLYYIPMPYSWSTIVLLEYTRLLITPVAALLLCCLWAFFLSQNTVLIGCKAAEDKIVLSRQKKLSKDCRTATMMFWSVALAFFQLDLLNDAKQMQGFGLFIPILCLIALLIVSIRYRFLIHICRR